MGAKYCGAPYLFWLGRRARRVDGTGLRGGGERLGGSLSRLLAAVGKSAENRCPTESDQGFPEGKTVELDVRPSGAVSANDRKEAGRRRLTLLSILVVQQTLTATIGQNRSWTNNSNQTSGRQVEFRQRTRTLSWRSILPIWPVFVTTAPSIS